MSVRGIILENLETKLIAIKDDLNYDFPIAEISRFEENVLISGQHRFPLIMIVDAGPETLIIEDGSYYHYSTDISLIGIVGSDTKNELQDELNKLISTIKQFIDSVPDLGDNAMRFRFLGLDSNIFETKTHILASTVINTRLRYWCAAGDF